MIPHEFAIVYNGCWKKSKTKYLDNSLIQEEFEIKKRESVEKT